MAINDSFDLREQGATAECEVFVCGERRDREIKLVQRVLSRYVPFRGKNFPAVTQEDAVHGGIQLMRFVVQRIVQSYAISACPRTSSIRLT